MDHRTALVVALAGRQRSLVTREQLLALGWSSTTISRRVREGWLRRVHPGVYAVGPLLLTPTARILAAALACGPSAVASHRSAGAIWGLAPLTAAPPHVTVGGARGRGLAGIVVHRALLSEVDRDEVDGVPVTSVARTLLDLGSCLGPRQLDGALERAEQLRLLDLRTLEDLLGRCRGHRGRGPLRRALARMDADAGRTRSELEARARGLLAEAGLPAPSVNVPVEGFEVDLAWPTARVVVELDGWQHHGGRRAFERDRRRDRVLQAAGWRIVRVTWRDLHDDPAALASDLARMLGVALGAHPLGVRRHAA